MFGLRLATVTLAYCLGLSAPCSAAEIRALLIGVSSYDEAIGLTSLRGPANDVRLWQSTLNARGVTDLRMLADGVDGGTIPTRAAILAAFSDLAKDSGPGDLAIVTMSGHGTRQPDQNGDETDGLDEIFLPADTGRAEAGSNFIPNALIDDEIGVAVDAIRATGADVWLIMDSCHSGSGLRAASRNVAARYVDPAILGITERSPATALSGGVDTGRTDLPGQVIAFYASRASEVAREVNFAPETPDDAAWYGLFTTRLAARVAGGEGLSYRQLFQAVLSDMNAADLPGGARMQTPTWEGSLGDAIVLGGRATSGVRQFAVTTNKISAGLIHGLGVGTLFSLYADAADPPDAVIGYAQMKDVSATNGFLRAVAPECTPRIHTPCEAVGALPQNARFARLTARPLDLVLRLSPPYDLTNGVALAAESAELLALEQAISDVNAAGETRVEIDANDYSIDVALADGALWFGRRVSVRSNPVGLEWRPDSGVSLAALLTRIASAERLATMLSSVGGGGSMLNPSPVRIYPLLVPSNASDLDPPGAASNPERECRRALQASAAVLPMPLPAMADLKQCDNLNFAAQGEIPGERDVNRIHIDSQFCVHANYAHVEDTTQPVPIGDPMIICSDCPDGKATGTERLFVIVTESPANAERLNLESMVETCGTNGGPPTRGAGSAQVTTFLEALGRRPDTRGAFGGMNISNVWVNSWEWQVLPKELITSAVQ